MTIKKFYSTNNSVISKALWASLSGPMNVLSAWHFFSLIRPNTVPVLELKKKHQKELINVQNLTPARFMMNLELA